MKKLIKITSVICSAVLLVTACPLTSYSESIITPELMEIIQSGKEELINVTIDYKENIVDREARNNYINEAEWYYKGIIYNYYEFSEEKVTELMTGLADSVNGNPDHYIKIFMEHYEKIGSELSAQNGLNAEELRREKEQLIWSLYNSLDKFSKIEYYKVSANKIIDEENLDPEKISFSTLKAIMAGQLTPDEIMRLSQRDDIVSIKYIKPAVTPDPNYNRKGKISDGIYSAIENNEETIEIIIMCYPSGINYSDIGVKAKIIAQEYADSLDTAIYTDDEIMEMKVAYCEELTNKMTAEAQEEYADSVIGSLGITKDKVTDKNSNYGSINCTVTAEELKTAVYLTEENKLVRRIITPAEWEQEIQPATMEDPTVSKNDKIKNGDLNGDNRINIADLVLMQQNITMDKIYSKAADMNNDGAVDVFDMILLKRIILGE